MTGMKLPKIYWPEAVNWVVHVLNQSPSSANNGVTPEEIWTGRKPSAHHFKVFGSVAHVHIPEAKRKKLDDKSIRCVFFGVINESKVYRMFDLVGKKIIISRDVVFDENEC